MTGHPMKITTVAWIAVAALAAACGKDKSTASPAPASASASASGISAAKPAPAAPTPAPSAPAAVTGGVDATVMAAAKKVAAECTWEDDGYFESSCPAKQAWDAIDFKADHAATLVAILEDKTTGMQQLASEAMYRQTEWFAEDKALEERILAVAGALPADAKGGTANKLGRVIGFCNLAKTGLFDKAKALVERADANEALRVGIVNWMLAGNQDSEPAYALTRDQATKGATPAIKVAALVALSAAYKTHATDEMCALWLDALPKLDDGPGAMIAAHLTNGDLQVNNQNEAFPYNWAMISSDDDTCPPATVDAALAAIDKRVAAGTAKDAWWVSALAGPSKSKNATPAQKAKAVEIAKKYVDNARYGGYQRGNALEALVELDAKAAKAIADKHIKDPDDSLQRAAGRVYEKVGAARP